MAERRFNEKDVGAILRRAAEIQEGVQAPEVTQGYSLPELEALGREIGIDPQIIREAVTDVASTPEKKMYLSGASGTVVIDETADGILSAEAWEDIVLDLRKITGRPGVDTAKENKREWTGGYDIGSLTLTAIVRDDKTHIRLLSETSVGIGLTWMIGGFITLLTSLFIGKALSRTGISWMITAGVIIIAALVMFLTVQSLVRAWDRKNRPKLHSLVSKVQSLVAVSPEKQAADIARRAAEAAEGRAELR